MVYKKREKIQFSHYFKMRNLIISLYYCFALILLCGEGETFLVNLAGAALASIPYLFNVEYLKVR